MADAFHKAPVGGHLTRNSRSMKKRVMGNKNRIWASVAAAAFVFAVEASGSVILFDNAAKLTDNFNRVGTSTLAVLSYNSAGYVEAAAQTNQAALYAYDLNGSTAGTTTFSLDVGQSLVVTTGIRFTTGQNSSFGIFFGNLTAILNVNQSSDNDQLRIFTTLARDNSATVGGVVGTSLTGVDFVTPTETGTFSTLTATLASITADQFTLTIAIGGRDLSYTFDTATNPLPTNFEIGMRAGNANTVNDTHISYFSVETIPEPSAAILVSAGLLGLCGRRKRI